MRRYRAAVTWWRWRGNLAIARRRYRRSMYLLELAGSHPVAPTLQFRAEQHLEDLRRLKLNEP